MTINRFLTTLMQVSFSISTAVVFTLIIRDLIRDRRAARHDDRIRIQWIFPPHSETERTSSAQRLFDADTVCNDNADTVRNDVDGVQ